jgi:hypothetical protein
MKKRFYQTSEFKKLKREWDQKLKDDGFEDIEDDKVPWRLKGMASVSLAALNPANPRRSQDPDKLNERSEDIDAAIVNFSESYRARYYYHAQKLASVAARRPGIRPLYVYSYQLHATGLSQREIAAELGTTRAKIRRILEAFSRQVKIAVDAET